MGCVPILVFIFAVLAAQGYAREVKFEVSVDNANIVLGESAQLGLTFYGRQDIPAPDLGGIDGFEARYLGPFTMMTVINGRMSSSVTHRYTLVPLRIGKFQLGPFSFKYKGDEYDSNSLFVEVREEPVARAMLAEEKPEPPMPNLEDRLFVTLAADKIKAYINELIPVTVKFYVNRLNVSDIQLPTFEQEGFSKVEFKDPKQSREEMGGTIYDTLEFKTNIFAARPGDYRLGPAKVKCNLVVKRKRSRKSPLSADEFDEFFNDSYYEDFFTSYERHPVELKSDDLAVKILPLPQEGRPRDFSGAVGDYQFIFSSSPSKLRVGDPTTLKMEINGVGNFNTALSPKLETRDGFRVYEPQVKTEPNRKTFTQVLIPETENVTQTPKAVFTFFDPSTREYNTITQGPLPIQVERPKDEPPTQVVGPAPSRQAPPVAREAPGEMEGLGRDIIYIKEAPGRMARPGSEIYKNRMALAALPLPAIIVAFFYIIYARTNRLKRDGKSLARQAAFRSAMAGLKSLRRQLKGQADQMIFYETIFKALQNYLGSRFGLPWAGITFDAIDERLAGAQTDFGIRAKTRALFETCDKARFASVSADEFKMRDDFRDLERVIKYFERAKR